jgi:hypothetical protein
MGLLPAFPHRRKAVLSADPAMGIHPVRPQSAHATAIRAPFAVNRALTSAAGNGGLNR